MYKVVFRRKHLDETTRIVSDAMLKTLIDETLQVPGFSYATVKNTVEKHDTYQGIHAGKDILITKSNQNGI